MLTNDVVSFEEPGPGQVVNGLLVVLTIHFPAWKIWYMGHDFSDKMNLHYMF